MMMLFMWQEAGNRKPISKWGIENLSVAANRLPYKQFLRVTKALGDDYESDCAS
jgi:predicted transcriptional regulator